MARAWGKSGLQGYDGDSSYSFSGSATYNFSDLLPGMYTILVNSPGKPNSSNRAVYTLSSGDQSALTYLDQRAGTHEWLTLMSMEVPVGQDSLEVRVSQGGTGVVRADAIRVVGTTEFYKSYADELDAYLQLHFAPAPQNAVADDRWQLPANAISDSAASIGSLASEARAGFLNTRSPRQIELAWAEPALDWLEEPVEANSGRKGVSRWIARFADLRQITLHQDAQTFDGDEDASLMHPLLDRENGGDEIVDESQISVSPSWIDGLEAER